MKSNELESSQQTYEAIRGMLEQSRQAVVHTVNSAMVNAYWEIGKEITEAMGERSKYGKGLLKYLSQKLTAEFGKGFTVSNLRNMRQFYMTFPIRHALRSELSWTHYRLLIRIPESKRRAYYLEESVKSGWTARQLERQINTLYYERLLATPVEGKDEVSGEVFEKEPMKDPKYLLKDPYILEFLDLKENKNYYESDIEQAMIDKMQEFLLELGRGFSFVARQKRLTTDNGTHYYIDLVFYNYILKCFVLIDVKNGGLTYQDIGQIDFYTRLFDEKMKPKEDNPTIGIVLTTQKDEAVAKYSVLSDKDNLFASKYSLYLPTEAELKAELERTRFEIECQLGNGGDDVEI